MIIIILIKKLFGLLPLFKQIVSSVVLMLFISVAVPSISLVGHLGGMIGGFVATFVLEKIDSKKERIIN